MTIRQVIEQVSRENGFTEDSMRDAHFFAITNTPSVAQHLNDEATEQEIKWIREFMAKALSDPQLQDKVMAHVAKKLKAN